MNERNARRPYSDRRWKHVNKMLLKLRRRGVSDLRIARAERAVDAAMIPF